MLTIDAHLDLSMNAVLWNRDITREVVEIRRAESGMKQKGRGTNTVSLPELRKAEIGICLATVIARCNPTGESVLDYRTQEIAWSVAQGELAYYQALCAQGKLRQLRTSQEISQHVQQWETAPVGFILAMEGADCVLDESDLERWHDAGLRVIGPAHYGPGVYAHGTGSQGPLTIRGRDLVRRMEELGLILDATHLADDSFWDALRRYRGPVLASHNNCRALVPGDRQFSDDQIRALIERDAVIGGVCDVWMLTPNWTYGETPREATGLSHLIDHMDRICQLAGNAKHIAVGSDLDGGYGTEQCPCDLDTIADLVKIPRLLAERGYGETDIALVMHGNWLRLFERALRT